MEAEYTFLFVFKKLALEHAPRILHSISGTILTSFMKKVNRVQSTEVVAINPNEVKNKCILVFDSHADEWCIKVDIALKKIN